MRIFALSESAVTIEFGNDISLDLNTRAIALAEHFRANPFPGLIEAVPAYSSVTLFFDPINIDLDSVREIVNSAGSSIEPTDIAPRVLSIPIHVSKEKSPDLERISEHHKLNEDEVMEIFLDRAYRVYMLGFLPGFAYMGEVDERIATPRLATPRTRVARGSIGIAGKQTGIYPLESPGGWNIIGRTDAVLFDPERGEPCLLRPGDEVRFVPA